MTTTERTIGIAIIAIFVLFVGSCAMVFDALFTATDDCQGLEGIVDAIWTGVDCAADPS